MQRVTDWFGTLVFGSLVAAVAVVFILPPPGGIPSEEECVELWNAPTNGRRRDVVVSERYLLAAVEVLYSEGRYEGCAFTFGDARGRGRWLRFAASRIPGHEQPPRFDGPWRGLGHDFRTPIESLYRLDHVVMPGGELADA